MKVQKGQHNEHGQITVIMLIAVIALLGAATLSIDGGMLYLERREAQSAADNAAMTGALAITRGFSGSEINSIVLERSLANGFDNSSDDVEIQVYWPPIAPNPYAGNSEYVQVIITSRIHTAFIHIIFQGVVETTVEAVAHLHPRGHMADGYALFGANETACQTMWFTGTPDVFVIKGKVGSNSTNGCDCGSLVTGGNVDVLVQNGNFTIAERGPLVGCYVSNGGSGTVEPLPPMRADQRSKEILEDLTPEPPCSSSVQDGLNINNNRTLSPGTYDYLKIRSHGEVNLEAGLYCISGSLDGSWGFETKGGSKLTGTGVTIYFMESAGGLKTAGNSEVKLSAPTGENDPWAGMLIHAHPDNTNDVILAGTSNSIYTGTVLALGSHCDVEGTGSMEVVGQVICDTVRVNGTGDLNITYDAALSYVHPANVDLAQ